MYPACIPHVSHMSPSYQIHLSLDAFEIHVSRMYPACILMTSEDTCIPHVSRMYLAHLRYVLLRIHLRYMYSSCIPHVSRMYPPCILEPLQIHVSNMYPACIPHVSLMYPTCFPPRRCAYLATATGARKGDEEGEDCCRAARPAQH